MLGWHNTIELTDAKRWVRYFRKHAKMTNTKTATKQLHMFQARAYQTKKFLMSQCLHLHDLHIKVPESLFVSEPCPKTSNWITYLNMFLCTSNRDTAIQTTPFSMSFGSSMKFS